MQAKPIRLYKTSGLTHSNDPKRKNFHYSEEKFDNNIKRNFHSKIQSQRSWSRL